MKNFIVFFDGQVGSCAILKTLNNIDDINIVDSGLESLEPFCASTFEDKLQKGYGKDISEDDYLKCLDIIFKPDDGNDYCKEIESIRSKYTGKAKINFSKNRSYGFKDIPRRNIIKSIYSILKKYNVVVFVLIRNNILRWSLSRYSRKTQDFSSQLQFEVAKKHINVKDIPKVKIDCRKFYWDIKYSEEQNKYKKELLQDLKSNGVESYPIYYEDFCYHKQNFIVDILKKLDINTSKEDIQEALKKDIYFKKVHSDNIKDFVLNYDEVYEKFKEYF